MSHYLILKDRIYIVPEALQKPVIKLYHGYAHVSQQLIQQNFWWWGMASDIERWCDTWIVCATINHGRPGQTKLCRPDPPKGPWELLQLDFIGPLLSANSITGRVHASTLKARTTLGLPNSVNNSAACFAPHCLLLELLFLHRSSCLEV